MEGKPQVSIIIPVFNAEKYLRDCITSILNQKYENIEVIAVDDGSIDLSASILSELKSQSSVMSVYTLSNQGVSAARNFGINKAHGKYVLFLDADDSFLPNAISLLVNEAERANAQMVSFNFETLFSDGSVGERPVEHSFPDAKQVQDMNALSISMLSI